MTIERATATPRCPPRTGRNTVLRAALALALVFGLAACDPGHEHGGTSPPPPATSSRLALDAGKRWKTDEATRAVFSRFHASVDQATVASADDIRALASAMDRHMAELFAGCTMTGPAHEQLHLLLGELLPAIEAFSRATGLARAREELQRVRQVLAEYDSHFE